MNILQAIADFATVTNVKRSTRKLLFIQKKKLLFTVLAHPASTPRCTHVQTCRCCWSVCSGGIPAHILAHHPPVYGWSFVSVWTQPAWGFFLLLLPLPHPGTESSSQRFSIYNCFLCCATICYYWMGNICPYCTHGTCLLCITFFYLNGIKAWILVGLSGHLCHE